jgi:hypothetical protein
MKMSSVTTVALRHRAADASHPDIGQREGADIISEAACLSPPYIKPGRPTTSKVVEQRRAVTMGRVRQIAEALPRHEGDPE